MGLQALATRARRAEKQARALSVTTAALGTTLHRIRREPPATLRLAGWAPDEWQASVLSAPVTDLRLLLNCARQSGKSLAAAGLAAHTALTRPGSLTLLLSPSQRQSGELFRAKVLPVLRGLGWPVAPARITATEVELANGSRVVSLPESEDTIRGFSAVSLLVIDEASRVSDDLARAVRPMLATSGGGLVALSTPMGKRGWWYEAWEGGKGPDAGRWRRVQVTADRCPRISAEFLAEERAALGPAYFGQEYLCEFRELIGAVFSQDAIDRAFAGGARILPLFPGGVLPCRNN